MIDTHSTAQPRDLDWHLDWQAPEDLLYEDILYHRAEGIARITINRPEVCNAFRPEMVTELLDAFHRAHLDPEVGVIILTGQGEPAAPARMPASGR